MLIHRSSGRTVLVVPDPEVSSWYPSKQCNGYDGLEQEMIRPGSSETATRAHRSDVTSHVAFR
jgi:hypothetical protein